MKIKKAVFPLAGIGSRLYPITKIIPKEMICILNKPIIQYSIEEIINSGINNIIFIVNNQKEMLKKYLKPIKINFKSNYELKILNSLISNINSICYVNQRKPLGLGHSILRIKKIIGKAPFIIILTDDLIKSKIPVSLQLIKYYKKINIPIISITKIKNSKKNQYGIIKNIPSNNSNLIKIKHLIEKPNLREITSNLAVVGRYILNYYIFKFLEKNNIGFNKEFQLTDAINKQIENNKKIKKKCIYGCLLKGNRYDCGTKLGIQKANKSF